MFGQNYAQNQLGFAEGMSRAQNAGNRDMQREQLGSDANNRAALLQLLGLNASVKRGLTGTPTLNVGGTLADTPIFQQLLGKSGPGGGGNGGSGYPGGGDLFDSQLADAENFGNSQRARIGRDFDASLGSTLARMEDRGLGSSNLSGAAQSQVDEARQQSLLGVEDAVLGQKIGIKGAELDRRQQSQLQLQGQGMNLVGSLLGMLR